MSGGSEPVAGAMEAVRDLEQQVITRELDSKEMGPLVAAARIRAWHDSLGAIFAVAEADIMECCLAIRKHHSSEESFAAFITLHVRVLTPAKARRLADTWEVARRHRPVRELVSREPKKAIAFVREFTAAAAAEELPLPLDASDQQLADILASPPKTRRLALGDLGAAARAPRDRDPADVARIEQLEAARAAREDVEAEHLPRDLRTAADELRTAVEVLAEACVRVTRCCADERPPEALADRLRRACDWGVSALDDVTARLADDDRD